MIFSQDFYKKMPRFCEHYYWTDGNEYLNTVTSFIMTAFGIMGLLKSNNLIITNILYSFLFSNGFFSALNHWYAYEGWRYADSLTMILPVSIGLITIIYIYQVNNNLSNMSNIMLYILYPPIVYVPIIIHKYTNIFSTLFAVLTLLLTLFVPISRSLEQYNDINNKKIIDNSITNFYTGFIFFLIGALLWILTEPKCRCKSINIEIKKKLGGLGLHILWHLFAGYAFYLMIESFNTVLNIM